MAKESYNYSLRWFFDNQEVHEIDAKTLLKSEQVLTDYLYSLSKELNLSFNVKIKARKVGSFEAEHVINFLVENRDITILVIGAALTKFFAPNPKPKESNLSNARYLADIQEKVNNGSLTLEQAESFVESSGISHKQKNSFFKTNKDNKEIKAIEVKQNHKVIATIPSDDFDNYIVESSKNENIISNAKIFIISPVIAKGDNELWSGEYENEKIRFYIKDKSFLKRAQNNEISFKTGVYINCELEKIIKNIDGKEKVSWNVLNVNKFAFDENHVFEFTRKKRTANKIIDGQMSLF